MLMHRGPYYAARWSLIKSLVTEASPSSILELGCGPGIWLSALESRYDIAGLDIRRDILLSASSNTDAALIRADACCLPFSHHSCDMVIGVDVIEHVKDDSIFLNEAKRVLKPKGHLLITTLIRARRGYVRRMSFDDHIREYSPEGIREMFADAGFDIVRVSYFYGPIQTIARETAAIFEPYRLLWPVMSLLTGIVCALFPSSKSEDMSGGIAVLAIAEHDS